MNSRPKRPGYSILATTLSRRLDVSVHRYVTVVTSNSIPPHRAWGGRLRVYKFPALRRGGGIKKAGILVGCEIRRLISGSGGKAGRFKVSVARSEEIIPGSSLFRALEHGIYENRGHESIGFQDRNVAKPDPAGVILRMEIEIRHISSSWPCSCCGVPQDSRDSVVGQIWSICVFTWFSCLADFANSKWGRIREYIWG